MIDPSTNRSPRYTLHGSPQIEAGIQELVDDVVGIVANRVPVNRCRALVLVGGYGRGEGGVAENLGVNGTVTESPHNNLDFLLVTRMLPGNARKDVHKQIDRDLQAIRRQKAIGIDFSTASSLGLRLSPCRVMWYDMRYGHRTVWGDPTFVPSLKHFRIANVPSWDIRNLMINRGSLLIINELLLRREDAATNPAIGRQLLRHAMKAVIGYGDALLFFLGQYHWSYAEKQRRMSRSSRVPRDFRTLYDEAIRFRFRPSGEAFADWDARRWNHHTRPLLAHIHLCCERLRLRRPQLSWTEYLPVALNHSLCRRLCRPIELARSMRMPSRLRSASLGTSFRDRLAVRWLGTREFLPLLFPAIAYRSVSSCKTLSSAADRIFQTDSLLRQCERYLELWGYVADPNFRNHYTALGCSTSEETAA